MKRVGVSIAVADAHEIVIEKADLVTQASRRTRCGEGDL